MALSSPSTRLFAPRVSARILKSTYSLDVKEDTTELSFNTAELKLSDLTITSPSLQKPDVYPASDLKLDTKQERATLALSSTLSAGSKVQVKVGFEGELTGSMMGYYRSAWEHEGKTKYYSLTQFEVRRDAVSHSALSE